MRLLSARIRDYRIHRDLPLEFDPRLTVIGGPNQSGKSTLAEALHRALFLPVKTGGAVLQGMQTSPFVADPEVELIFEAGAQRWTLRKRFAGSRGSASLSDARGRSLQGEEAEERLAQLIGTAAVARNRGAGDQLRERWGHLWVWQGSASDNPLRFGAAAYDHDRLVERLQAGADLGVTSALDLRVLEDINDRWSSVFTPGGANRAPQVRKGSALQLARAAVDGARTSLAAIEARIAEQAADADAWQEASTALARLSEQLPLQRQRRQALQHDLSRSRELSGRIDAQQPQLEALIRDSGSLERERTQWQQERQRFAALTAAQAPGQEALAQRRERLGPLQDEQRQSRLRLEAQQELLKQAEAEARAIEQRLQRQRLLEERQRIRHQLAQLEELRTRYRDQKRQLAELPEVDAAGVERLRRLESAVQTADARLGALATGVEVIRADEGVQLDGVMLETGASRLLLQPSLLRIGEAVEIRLLPGGGSSTAEAAEALERARAALREALAGHRLATVEEVAQAERQRSDLLAELRRLEQQARGAGDADRLTQRLLHIDQHLRTRPPQDEEDSEADAVAEAATDASDEAAAAASNEEDRQRRITALESALAQAREQVDQAQTELRACQQRSDRSSQAVQALQREIETAAEALRQQENLLLEARTRCETLEQRHGSAEALDAAISDLEQRRATLQAALDALRAELRGLDPERLDAEARSLERSIAALEQQEREAIETRIRAEERLHGDGQTDLQAEREQRQAELESRQQEQERREKEAAMLTLLRRLLEEEQNAMGSQYTAPIQERLDRALAAVFPEAPEARLAYDARDGFQDLQWRRGSESAFAFEVLSIGAREQFAAALRVAMAQVLAEAYDGCLPLLFDDAFANSDPERQAGVHRMLQDAADQGLQVILLTCDPERSRSLAAADPILLGT